MSDMSKFGIKGNTGLGVGGMFHVSAPYDGNGKVFIESGDGWKRVRSVLRQDAVDSQTLMQI